ncbi:hypothetical protein M9H77_29585 [Catharanthus roseus]|uniref:Uncharacterized protein n=1 Tax=Catharanthus roseus TaxID=4058 RepID=A0ACB9ZX18_CATRO|nr:hypothetical protein M9H77_29585 [Catharanthus roseus]
MTDCGLSWMTRNIRPSMRRPQETGSRDEAARVLASIRQKEHEHSITGAPMPTDHELMLELNEGLKKGHTYGFGEEESALVMRSIWPPSVFRPLLR